MQNRHLQRSTYFQEQGITTEKYVIPYIQQCYQINADTRVLEIGCGEGGNLIPFLELGCEVIGVDINEGKLNKGRQWIDEISSDFNCTLLLKNIYDVSDKDIGQFDLIFMRDVIEHIPNQEVFMNHLKVFLKESGKVFFGFPPWRMPFGGHQQICKSNFLSKLPYYHLFPRPIYTGILKLFGEKKNTIDALLEIKDTGISINRFETIVNKNQYKFDLKTMYLINPNYKIKFGLTPRVQFSLLQQIPILRDFLTSCYYCVISQKR